MKPTLDMTASPYDRKPSVPIDPTLVQLHYKPKQRWVPSRFNARAVAGDGRLILWNTYSGAVSVFLPKDRDQVIAHLDHRGFCAPLSKTGQYLEKRGYLVPADADELDRFRYRYSRQQWRTDTLQLILLASEDCNFRCVYCYEKFQRGTMAPEVRQGIRALVLARAPKLRELNVSWFGGEPLYGWEAIEELQPFLNDVSEQHGIRYAQHMTTNAYLLTEEKATKLLDWGCRDYQITIDGLPEEHNCKRVGRDGSPTHGVILDNLRSLRDRKDTFTVGLRVNFDQENFPRLGAFLEALSEDFAGDPRFELRFRAVGKWGGENDADLATCGVTEQRQIVRQLHAKADEVNLHQERGVGKISHLGAQVCYAARPYNFIVGASGKLMKCTIALDDLDANVVGQLHPDGTMEIHHEHMIKWVKPYFETDALCQKCYVLPGCQGAMCPLSRITHGERTCCSTKGQLKEDLRLTLAESDAQKARSVVLAAAT